MIRKHSFESSFLSSLSEKIFSLVFIVEEKLNYLLINLLRDIPFLGYFDFSQIVNHDILLILTFFSTIFSNFSFSNQVDLLPSLIQLIQNNFQNSSSKIRIQSIKLLEAILMDFSDIDFPFEDLIIQYISAQYSIEETKIFMDSFSSFIGNECLCKNIPYYFGIIFSALNSDLQIPFRSLLFPVLEKMFPYCQNQEEIFKASFLFSLQASSFSHDEKYYESPNPIFEFFFIHNQSNQTFNDAILLMKEHIVDQSSLIACLNLASCLIEGMSSYVSGQSELFDIIKEISKIDDPLIISELYEFFYSLSVCCPHIVSEKIQDFFSWLLPISSFRQASDAIFVLFSSTTSSVPFENVLPMIQNVACFESFGSCISAISSILISSDVENDQYANLLQPLLSLLVQNNLYSEFLYLATGLINVCPSIRTLLYQHAFNSINQFCEDDLLFHLKDVLRFLSVSIKKISPPNLNIEMLFPLLVICTQFSNQLSSASEDSSLVLMGQLFPSLSESQSNVYFQILMEHFRSELIDQKIRAALSFGLAACQSHHFFDIIEIILRDFTNESSSYPLFDAYFSLLQNYLSFYPPNFWQNFIPELVVVLVAQFNFIPSNFISLSDLQNFRNFHSFINNFVSVFHDEIQSELSEILRKCISLLPNFEVFEEILLLKSCLVIFEYLTPSIEMLNFLLEIVELRLSDPPSEFIQDLFSLEAHLKMFISQFIDGSSPSDSLSLIIPLQL